MKLLKITTSKSLNMFLIKLDDNTTKMFFTNTEQSDKFEPLERNKTKYNKNSLYTCIGQDEEGNNIYKTYYNLYDSSTAFYKSAIYKAGKSQRTGTTYDFLNITNHKMSADLMNAVQVNNIIYSIEPKNQYGRYDLSCDIWSWISIDNSYALPMLKKIETDIYDYDYIKGQFDQGLSVEPELAVSLKLDYIEYNMLYEINGNIYNDYESGNIATNTFKAKNQFDSSYDMYHTSENILADARDYITIDKCNNQIYLKYYDNINYKSNAEKIKKVDNKYGFKYLNVEIINSINRYASFNGHTANLYSIAVTTDILDKIKHKEGLTEDNINTIMQNVILEMKNCIKAIVLSIQPAHTLLYAVYINGQ